MTWFVDFFANLSRGLAYLWEGLTDMFPLLTLLLLVLIAALVLFHVLIVKAAMWGFVAVFIAIVAHNMTRKEPRERKAEPNLENAFPVRESHIVPPQGGDATIPVARPSGGQSNTALIRLMKYTDRELNARTERAGEAGPSDASYEAVVTYPMEMEQEV